MQPPAASPQRASTAVGLPPQRNARADALSRTRGTPVAAAAPAPAPKPAAPAPQRLSLVADAADPAVAAPPPPPAPAQAPAPADRYTNYYTPPPAPSSLFPGRDTSRIESFASNPTQTTRENPVSTFSIDVDTASYSYVRRILQGGAVPQPQTVRVEELVNYFPYEWKGPDSKDTPFKANVSVLPTPWNSDTKLMHIAIKGYDISRAEKPRANLVFLIDVSGSMEPADRLPLLKTAFRMLVNTLSPDDTVAIVTYAGTSAVALQPTKASDKARIIEAIAKLQAGGSTNGADGLRQAYRLARESFIKDGVNRVMLATDGDFNVGQTSDADLRQLIEDERRSGVYLSVFGVGLDNLNDRMMQQIAQAGNGIAAYIDNLAQAQKVLVQEATSSIFPIANDVKIQVEFNPATIAEYRLIGYETRALERQDFNNDHVDAGDIGSGHTVTAIYEITPKGSPAQRVDDLRYGRKAPATDGGDDEYGFVKIRYKLPGGTRSTLITTPVTRNNAISSFAAASSDQRFSVAVAAFAQKLRRSDQLSDFSYDAIIDIANGAKGSDPYGYRGEFISLVRLASALLPNP